VGPQYLSTLELEEGESSYKLYVSWLARGAPGRARTCNPMIRSHTLRTKLVKAHNVRSAKMVAASCILTTISPAAWCRIRHSSARLLLSLFLSNDLSLPWCHSTAVRSHAACDRRAVPEELPRSYEPASTPGSMHEPYDAKAVISSLKAPALRIVCKS